MKKAILFISVMFSLISLADTAEENKEAIYIPEPLGIKLGATFKKYPGKDEVSVKIKPFRAFKKADVLLTPKTKRIYMVLAYSEQLQVNPNEEISAIKKLLESKYGFTMSENDDRYIYQNKKIRIVISRAMREVCLVYVDVALEALAQKEKGEMNSDNSAL